MSTRASIRRIERLGEKRRRHGRRVLNLCGEAYRLGGLRGPTGAHPYCYASLLGNCGGGISKEHYVSDNILEQLDFLDTSGLPWLKNAEGTIAPRDALNGKCLCEYHNSFLSPLDSLAGAVFDNFAKSMDPEALKFTSGDQALRVGCLKCSSGWPHRSTFMRRANASNFRVWIVDG